MYVVRTITSNYICDRYPVGMGDLATSLSLLGAVSSMLRRRVLHGVGGAVTGLNTLLLYYFNKQ